MKIAALIGSTVLRQTTDYDGYWALGYYQYFAGNKKLFGCPDGKLVDDYPPDYLANWTYGLCQVLLIPYHDAGHNTALPNPVRSRPRVISARPVASSARTLLNNSWGTG